MRRRCCDAQPGNGRLRKAPVSGTHLQVTGGEDRGGPYGSRGGRRCQLSDHPAIFGFLFTLVGCVLTGTAYGSNSNLKARYFLIYSKGSLQCS
nr:unnamed protein product [Callosobruchus analis]CAI5850292.1 unnamed protein product [Callosobruchus analis]